MDMTHKCRFSLFILLIYSHLLVSFSSSLLNLVRVKLNEHLDLDNDYEVVSR